jgi:hypothetical protein
VTSNLQFTIRHFQGWRTSAENGAYWGERALLSYLKLPYSLACRHPPADHDFIENDQCRDYGSSLGWADVGEFLLVSWNEAR